MKQTKPFYKAWWFIVIVIFVVLAVIGALIEDNETENTVKVESNEVVEKETNVNKDEPTSYKLLEKKHNDSGQTFLTIEVDTEDIDVAKKIVEGIVEDPYKATGYDPGRAKIESLYIQIYNTGNDNVWMNARVALTQTGLAQTGLEKVNTINFEENK